MDTNLKIIKSQDFFILLILIYCSELKVLKGRSLIERRKRSYYSLLRMDSFWYSDFFFSFLGYFLAIFHNPWRKYFSFSFIFRSCFVDHFSFWTIDEMAINLQSKKKSKILFENKDYRNNGELWENFCERVFNRIAQRLVWSNFSDRNS